MQLKRWKKLSEKLLFEHPWLTVFEDSVELSNGRTKDYLRFAHKFDCAIVIVQRKDGKILVNQQYRYGADEIMYEIPGGMIESNEKPEDGARREVEEETGIYPKKMHYIGYFYISKSRVKDKIHIFYTDDFEIKQKKIDYDEEIINHWFNVEEIEQMIRTNEIFDVYFLASWSLLKVNKII